MAAKLEQVLSKLEFKVSMMCVCTHIILRRDDVSVWARVPWDMHGDEFFYLHGVLGTKFRSPGSHSQQHYRLRHLILLARL